VTAFRHGVASGDPEQVQVEWWTVDALETRSPNQERSMAMAVRRGDPRLVPA